MGSLRPDAAVRGRGHEHDRVARSAGHAVVRGRATSSRSYSRRGANPNTQLKLRRPEFRNAIGERGADNSLATGATPLLRAAHAADVETIEQLLAHGALVDLPNATGLTPFMAAAGLGVSPRSNKARYADTRDAAGGRANAARGRRGHPC